MLRIHSAVLACLFASAVFGQVKSFDTTAIDTKVNPCVDFYQYACGTWLANNPIPPDQSSWGRFSELDERNRETLRGILDKAAAAHGASGDEQKLGDYYGACMDEQGIETRGTAPLKPVLNDITALRDKAALTELLVTLHRIGVGALFRFGQTQDYKNAEEVIAEADQGGLGLPDRDYYLKTDAKSADIRAKYVAHIERNFQLLGDTPAVAAARAKVVMDMETALAKGSMDRVARREPMNTYHRMDVAQFAATIPSLNVKTYLAGIGAPPVKSLNIASPDFFKAADALIRSEPVENWKTYLTWHYLLSSAPMLPKAFVEENFNFYSKTLRGQQEMRPRWKRCVAFTDGDLGELLGKQYVELTFGKEGKERTLAMVSELEKSLGNDIQKLDWMTPATKEKALEKLHAITNKIGYPDKWRKYTYEVRRDDALGNSQRANTFEFQRQMNKIGKPVDKSEWQMTPPTVNAYYDPQNNNINFPAGILQPPFYSNKAGDAVNLGGIGAVIGHELTHGFDDEGRQFDAKGNLRDWWTPADAKAFDERAECFVKEYSGFSPVPGVNINGKLTLGENVADNGGLRIAFMSLMDDLAGKQSAKEDGYTQEQRFFISYAQIWCTNDREETARLRATVDPHSPGKYRVIGTLSNMPEFQQAFGCKAGQPMVRENACRVW